MSFMNTVAFEVRGVLGGNGATQERRPYLGCWSHPEEGDVLYITLKTIQFSHSNDMLSYEEVFNDLARHLYLLKLTKGSEFRGLLAW